MNIASKVSNVGSIFNPLSLKYFTFLSTYSFIPSILKLCFIKSSIFVFESMANNTELFSTQNEITSFIIFSLDKPISNTFSTLNLLKNVGIISTLKKLNI